LDPANAKQEQVNDFIKELIGQNFGGPRMRSGKDRAHSEKTNQQQN
jgi:hypothetical protein